MQPLKTVRLVLHAGRHSVSWGLVLRTDDGRTVFDRRLHAGLIEDAGVLQGIADVSAVLRHIADEIEPDAPRGLAAQPLRAPLGAVGGGSQHRPGRVCAADCPRCGEHLDGMPSDD